MRRAAHLPKVQKEEGKMLLGDHFVQAVLLGAGTGLLVAAVALGVVYAIQWFAD